MSNQDKKNDPDQPEYQKEQEFESGQQNNQSDGDSAAVHIKPSESKESDSSRNQTGDPGRTPGKAEG